MKYTEIKNFIKNNNLVVTHMYSEQQKTSRRVTYCILNDLTDFQRESLKNFCNNNNLKNFKLSHSKYTPYFKRYYLKFSVWYNLSQISTWLLARKVL
jgi:hypothetical protein